MTRTTDNDVVRTKGMQRGRVFVNFDGTLELYFGWIELDRLGAHILVDGAQGWVTIPHAQVYVIVWDPDTQAQHQVKQAAPIQEAAA